MNTYAIFTKELRGYFVSPALYVVLVAFFTLSGYFFYTDIALYSNWIISGRSNPVEGLFYYYFMDLRFILMLLMPLMTMRLFAEEKRVGTFELLATYPVRDVEVLAGKYLASMTVLILILTVTLANFLLLGFFWGFYVLPVLFAGFLGLMLFGCSLIACGIFISSLTENQAVAAMGTFGIFVMFWFLTWNEMIAGEEIIKVLARFSLFDRIEYFFKGLIDSKDVIFFLLFIFFLLGMTLLSLKARTFWKSDKKFYEGPIITVLLVTGIAVALEIVSFRHNVRIDLTPTKSYSLAAQTVKVLRELDRDIRFAVFYKEGQRKDLGEFFARLSLYTPHVKYSLIDLDRNPAQAKLQNITTYGQTIVEYGGKRDVLSVPTEESVVTLLIKYLHQGKRRIYFTQGHGENSPDKEYSDLDRALRGEGWQVGVIDLSGKEAAVALKNSLLVVGGPQKDFDDGEIGQMANFLKGGGKLILMVEPFVRLPRLEALLAKFDIGLGSGVVVDSESRLMGGDFLSPLISNFAKGFVADSFTSPAIFPTARPVEIKEGGTDRISYLAKSSARSWVAREKISPGKGEVYFKAGVDRKGPVPVALMVVVTGAASERTGTLGALLCFGDADFVNNQFIGMMANQDLFMNTVNWLEGVLDLISTRPQQYEYPYHYLTQKQGYLIFWLAVVIIPLIPLIMGVSVYLYRRRRG